MVVDFGLPDIHQIAIEELIINGLSKLIHLSPPFCFFCEELFID
jgi:hypothetical protein